MRILSIALILFAFIAIAGGSTAQATTRIDSYYYLDNDIEATVHVEVFREQLSNGLYRFTYVIRIYPVTYPPLFTSYTRTDLGSRPTLPEEEECVRRYCDPNCNGVPRWIDPTDKIEIDYQLQ